MKPKQWTWRERKDVIFPWDFQPTAAAFVHGIAINMLSSYSSTVLSNHRPPTGHAVAGHQCITAGTQIFPARFRLIRWTSRSPHHDQHLLLSLRISFVWPTRHLKIVTVTKKNGSRRREGRKSWHMVYHVNLARPISSQPLRAPSNFFPDGRETWHLTSFSTPWTNWRNQFQQNITLISVAALECVHAWSLFKTHFHSLITCIQLCLINKIIKLMVIALSLSDTKNSLYVL